MAQWSDVDVTTEHVVSCDAVDADVCVTTKEGAVILYNTDDQMVGTSVSFKGLTSYKRKEIVSVL